MILLLATSTPTSLRFRRVILATQVGAATTVAIVAGLFVQTVDNGFKALPGFDDDHTAFLSVQPTQAFLPASSGDVAQSHFRMSAGHRLIDELSRLTGVQAVAVGPAPLGDDALPLLYASRRFDTAAGHTDVIAGVVSVGSSFLSAVGADPLAGRTSGSTGDVVVTESLANQLWPGEDPLGERVRTGSLTGTVVGVVDVAFGSIMSGHAPAMFALGADAAVDQILANGSPLHLTVRARDPELLRTAIFKSVHEAFPSATALSVKTGRELVARDIGQQRLGAWFFSGFSLIAFGLAASGVLGLVSYVVRARAREFSIMSALGASTRVLVRAASAEAVVPGMIGATLGTVTAFLGGGWLREFLIGIDIRDPAPYLAVTLPVGLGLCVVGVLAARRVHSVSPMDVLRSD